MITLCILIVIFLLCVILFKKSKNEHFTLFTANPVKFVCSSTIDNAPRHVKFNNANGISYISNYSPSDKISKQIKCPKFVDELVTLGKNNYCWKNI